MPPITSGNPRPPHTDEFITLKEYVDTKFCYLDRAMETNNKNLELRLASLNEIRDALRDRDATFITKVEFNAILTRLEGCINGLETDIRSLRESRSLLEGKASQSSVNIAMIISVVSLLIGLVGILMGLFGI
jgi:hypothetical protein